MKIFKFAFFICLLGIAHCGYSQDSPKVDIKIDRLLDAIYEYHFMPRKIDEAFIQDFQELFFEAIDPVEIILTEEEVVTIRNMSNQLEGTFRMDAAAFVDSTYVIWSKGIERAQRLVAKAQENPMNFDVPTDSALFNTFVLEHQLAEKIQAYQKLQTLSEAVDAMADAENYNEPEAFLDSAQTTVQEGITFYFESLSGDRDWFDEVFLNALANTFDPHTAYFNNSEYEDFKEELSSERERFGISYKKNNNGVIEISALMPGSSAWLSGEIHVGDIVIGIDFGNEKHSLEGKAPKELGELFKDNDSKEIILTVRTSEGPTPHPYP